jgi:hypothetical protein
MNLSDGIKVVGVAKITEDNIEDAEDIEPTDVYELEREPFNDDDNDEE